MKLHGYSNDRVGQITVYIKRIPMEGKYSKDTWKRAGMQMTVFSMVYDRGQYSKPHNLETTKQSAVKETK